MLLYVILADAGQTLEEFTGRLPAGSQLILGDTDIGVFLVKSDLGREMFETAFPSADGWCVGPDAVGSITKRVWRDLGFQPDLDTEIFPADKDTD